MLNWIKLAVVAVIAGGAFIAIDSGQIAPIERVTCTGPTPLTEARIYHWLSEHMPASMLSVRPAAMRQQIMDAFPLRDVRVSRKWPDEVQVFIDERKPYAMALGVDGDVQLVDRSGKPVTRRRDQAVAIWDRPIIRGCHLEINDGDYVSDCVRMGVGFMAWLDMTDPAWLENLSEIVVDQDAVSVYLTDGLLVDFGKPPFGPKLDQLRYAWTLANQNKLDVTGVRLTGRDQVIIELSESPGGMPGA